MKKISKLSSLFLLPLTIGAFSSLVACQQMFVPGDANTDNLDVNIDTRGVTITMWTGFGAKINSTMDELLEEFTKKTGIKVEYEAKGGYPNLLKAINLASTSGAFPNIANGYPDHFASYIKSNILLRLDGLIANDHLRGEAEGAYNQNGIRYAKDGIQLMNYQDFYKDYTVENETLEYKEDGTGYVSIFCIILRGSSPVKCLSRIYSAVFYLHILFLLKLIKFLFKRVRQIASTKGDIFKVPAF